VLPLLCLAVVLGLVAGVAGVADDKNPADKPLSCEGKIQSMDVGKRELVLADARPTPAPGGKGTEEKGKEEKGRTMTFTVAENAKVTLDGKPATLNDLKAGQFARVYARQGETKPEEKGKDDKGQRLMAERIEARTAAEK